MKILSLVFLLSSLLGENLNAQQNLREQLMGYWYFEEEDSVGLYLEKGTFKRVHKLYFTPDSLLISNFGDTEISRGGAYWSCDKGDWSMMGDTLKFKPISATVFSCNTGFFANGGSKLDFACIVKSVDKDSLVIVFKEDGRLASTLVEPTYSRVYKKMPHIEMYDGPPSPFPASSPPRWRKQ